MTVLRRAFTSAAGGMPRVFWYLWLVTLINRLGSFVLIYLALYLSAVRGLEPGTIGLLLAGQGLGAVIGTHVSGVLADRWGRRKTLLLSIACTMVTYVLLAVSLGLLLIGALLAILGAVSNMARPAFSSIISDIVPQSDRVRAYTLNHWAINLGHSGAALLGGFVLAYDYQLIFVLNAITIAVVGAMVWRKIPETKPNYGESTDSVSRSPFTSDPVFTLFVILTFLPIFMLISLETLLPLQVTGVGLTERDYGLIIAVNGVTVAVGQLFIPTLIAGRRRSTVLALACVLWAIGFAATGVVETVPLFMLTVLIWTAGEMLQTPANSATVADLAPTHMRGRYQASYALAWQAAMLLAPLVGGLALQYIGDNWWRLGALIGVAAAVGNLLAEPARERRLRDVS